MMSDLRNGWLFGPVHLNTKSIPPRHLHQQTSLLSRFLILQGLVPLSGKNTKMSCWGHPWSIACKPPPPHCCYFFVCLHTPLHFANRFPLITSGPPCPPPSNPPSKHREGSRRLSHLILLYLPIRHNLTHTQTHYSPPLLLSSPLLSHPIWILEERDICVPPASLTLSSPLLPL